MPVTGRTKARIVVVALRCVLNSRLNVSVDFLVEFAGDFYPAWIALVKMPHG